MKRFVVGAFVTAVAVIFLAPRVYAIRPLAAPSQKAADPTALLLTEQGIKQYEEQQWEAAYASFKLASEIDPTLAAAEMNRAVALSKMGHAPEAISSLETFVAGNPEIAEGRRLLSDVKRAYFKGRPPRPASGLGGFAEFGAASLIAFIYMMAVAAYDIGAAHPFRKEEEGIETWMEERWREAA